MKSLAQVKSSSVVFHQSEMHSVMNIYVQLGTLYKGFSAKRHTVNGHTAKRHAAKRHNIRITRVSFLKHRNQFIYFLEDLVRFSIILDLSI